MTKQRCPWPKNELALRYHDEEWGTPVYDDQKQFEFLVLESAQAGLSWDTVLKKRENYRAAFAEFDPIQVAQFDDAKLEALLLDAGLIRNRQKIAAAIHNAKEFLKIQAEFGSFSKYIWSFVDNTPVQNEWTSMQNVPATSPESDKLSKDMKRRGFKFVGSTILYAHMQATGLINDHLTTCFRHKACAKQ